MYNPIGIFGQLTILSMHSHKCLTSYTDSFKSICYCFLANCSTNFLQIHHKHQSSSSNGERILQELMRFSEYKYYVKIGIFQSLTSEGKAETIIGLLILSQNNKDVQKY